MAAQIHVNDVGVVFRYTLVKEDGDAIDVSGASSIQIKYRSPGGELDTIDATFTTDGTDGVVEARTFKPLIFGGNWTAQVYLAGVSGFTGHSEIDQFPVLANIG